MRQIIVVATLAMVWCAVGATRAQAQVGTAFTYQGELVLGATPVNGTADFRCSLWDAEAIGLQYGGNIELNNVPVSNGVFVLKLDFGSALYLSPAKWLQIEVRSPSGAGDFTTLAPRQEITSAPFAVKTRGLNVDDQNNITMPLGPNFSTVALQSLSGIELIIDADRDNLGDETQNARIVLQQDGGQVTGRIGYQSGQNRLEVMNDFDDALILGTGGNTHVFLNGAGNMGLGTTSPSAKFHLLAEGDTQTVNVNTFGTGNGARFAITNFNNANPALAAATTGSGPALRASGGNDDTPAIDVTRGSFKVSGAGVDTDTFVFIHNSNAQNTSGSGTQLDHPLINGDRNAILLITVNVTNLDGAGGVATLYPTGVTYNNGTQRWSIYNLGNQDMLQNINFNVMVIKP